MSVNLRQLGFSKISKLNTIAGDTSGAWAEFNWKHGPDTRGYMVVFSWARGDEPGCSPVSSGHEDEIIPDTTQN